MSQRPTSYLICGTPRSGSTLLCDLLTDSGVAGRPESYFRRGSAQLYADRWPFVQRPNGRIDDRAFLAAAIGAGTTPNGVFAARVM